MEAASPPRLSGLFDQFLRSPPSLREMVTVIGYADDYAWFVGLVRRTAIRLAVTVQTSWDLLDQWRQQEGRLALTAAASLPTGDVGPLNSEQLRLALTPLLPVA